MQRIWQFLNVFFAAIFVFGAILQYNDPHPLPWALVYLAAALPCALVVLKRPGWRLPAVAAIAAGAWCSVYIYNGAWTVPFGEMFSEWEMKNQAVVQTREMFGLGIITTWMVILAFTAWIGGRSRSKAKEKE